MMQRHILQPRDLPLSAQFTAYHHCAHVNREVCGSWREVCDTALPCLVCAKLRALSVTTREEVAHAILAPFHSYYHETLTPVSASIKSAPECDTVFHSWLFA